MNFSQLYNKLLSVLAETTSPQYWSETELKKYINDGLIEFVKRTHFLQKHAYLDKSDLESGAYFLPLDIIEPIGVQFRGRPLDKKSIKFLESAYSGTAHQKYLVGTGYPFTQGWREMEGDPIHWFFESQFVKVFPKPSLSVAGSSSNLLKTIPATLYEGNAVIQLPIPLPYGNQHLIDLYIGGIYQNIGDWSIDPADSSRILLPYTSLGTAPVEVCYQNSAVVATKFGASVSEGQTAITINDCFYNDSTDSLKVMLDGVKLTSSDFIASVPSTNDLLITLNDPAEGDCSIEVTIYKPLTASDSGDIVPSRISDTDVTMDYIYLPETLVDDTDEPEIPTFFHDVCWQWAAYLALSKEGEMTQDLKKAMIYSRQFEVTISPAEKFTETEIDIEPAVQMPWVL
jgi:hypothetical protein